MRLRLGRHETPSSLIRRGKNMSLHCRLCGSSTGWTFVFNDSEVIVGGWLRLIGGASERPLVCVRAGAVGRVPLALNDDASEFLLSGIDNSLVLSMPVPGYWGQDEPALLHCSGNVGDERPKDEKGRNKSTYMQCYPRVPQLSSKFLVPRKSNGRRLRGAATPTGRRA